MKTPSSVGVDLSTDVVTGMMSPGGHVIQTGSGVVVDDVVVVLDVVELEEPGFGPVVVGNSVTKEQSWVMTAVEAARNVITLEGGQSKWNEYTVGVGHARLKVVRENVTRLCGGQETVVWPTMPGFWMVVTVGPVALMVVMIGVSTLR